MDIHWRRDIPGILLKRLLNNWLCLGTISIATRKLLSNLLKVYVTFASVLNENVQLTWLFLPLVVGEEVTDWLGDTGVLLVTCCDVLVETMVPKRGACVVTVSLLVAGYVEERFVGTDDGWLWGKDDSLVEFEEKAGVCVCGVARECDGDTKDGDIDWFRKTPRRKSFKTLS